MAQSTQTQLPIPLVIHLIPPRYPQCLSAETAPAKYQDIGIQ